MKKATSVLAVVIILTIILTACSGTENKTITGTWTVTEDSTTMTFELNTDGTGSVSTLGGLLSVDFAYKLKGNTVTFYEINEDVLGSDPFIYELKGDTLKLIRDGETMTLTREK